MRKKGGREHGKLSEHPLEKLFICIVRAGTPVGVGLAEPAEAEQ